MLAEIIFYSAQGNIILHEHLDRENFPGSLEFFRVEFSAKRKKRGKSNLTGGTVAICGATVQFEGLVVAQNMI